MCEPNDLPTWDKSKHLHQHVVQNIHYSHPKTLDLINGKKGIRYIKKQILSLWKHILDCEEYATVREYHEVTTWKYINPILRDQKIQQINFCLKENKKKRCNLILTKFYNSEISNATENKFQYTKKSKVQYIPTISEKRKRMVRERTRHG